MALAFFTFVLNKELQEKEKKTGFSEIHPFIPSSPLLSAISFGFLEPCGSTIRSYWKNLIN